LSNTSKSALAVIFITVFIDLVGFGIIIPLSPYLASKFGASALEIGLLLGVYSLMQVIFAPFWGRWSDRLGRRPIILFSLMGTGLAHLAFAFSKDFTMLLVARAVAGIFGANISTAMAYVADVTKNKDRSKGMGLVGAAFGLGFILGPLLGGLLSDLGSHFGSEPPFGMSFGAVFAGILCFLNTAWAFFVLPETHIAGKAQVRKSRWEMVSQFLSRPVVGPLLFIAFLFSFSMAQMEVSLFLFVKDRYLLTVSQASLSFALVGVVMAFTQGYLIRKILPRFGERKLILWGIVASGLALALVGFTHDLMILAVIVIFMSLGFGLRNPSLTGTISMSCNSEEQGSVMGVNQSLSALGRILGPPLGGWLYGTFGAESNFAIAGIFSLLGIPILMRLYDLIPDSTIKNQNFSDLVQEKIGPTQETSSSHKNPVPSGPIFVPERPRVTRAMPTTLEPEPESSVQKMAPKMENKVTKIGAFQFRNIFSQNVPYVLLDFRAEGSLPQYSRAVRTTPETMAEILQSRVTDKRYPVIFVCEDGETSQQQAEKAVEMGYINAVVLEGGTKSLDKTGYDPR